MRYKTMLPLALLAALAACKTTGNPTSPQRTKAPLSTPATAPVSTAALPPATPLQKLLAPPGERLQVAGSLTVDAAYMVASGQGRIIANHGSSAVILDGAPIISDNGGNIAPADLVTGGRLLSENGLGLIGRTRLLSENGLGLVAPNGATYSLLAAATPAAGEELPAVGMLVGVVGLADGKLVPIGVDAAGKEVFSVLTGADGHYELYLPKETHGNVRVVALPPKGADVRLEYGAVFAPGQAAGKTQALDGAEAIASAFLRVQMTRFLELYLAHDKAANQQRLVDGRTPAAVIDIAMGVIEEFRDIATKNGYYGKPAAARRNALQLAVDAMLAPMDLAALQLDPAVSTSWKGPKEPALAAMASVVRLMNARTATLLAKDAHTFDNKPYMTAFNRARLAAGAPAIAIRRPDDLAAIALGEFFAGTDPAELMKVDQVLADIDLPASERDHLKAAAGVVYQALFLKLVVDEDFKAIVRTQLGEAFKAGALPEPAGSAEGVAAPPTPPAPEAPPRVTTLAGDGTDALVDGPAAAVRLADPHGLVLREDATGLRLYFTDNYRVRCLARAADGSWSGSTVAGSTAGHVDGPGTLAKFRAPIGIALDKLGRLLVGESPSGYIRRIDLNNPTFPVTTLAGGATDNTDTDGPAATAAFNGPLGLAELPDGKLLVACISAQIRLVDLPAPGSPVTTLTGAIGPELSGLLADSHFFSLLGLVLAPDGRYMIATDGAVFQVEGGRSRLLAGNRYAGQNEGFWADARLRAPSGLALDAAGNLFVSDRDNNRIVKITPLGDVQALAGEVLHPGPRSEGSPGSFADGVGAAARFNKPDGIAIDAKGNLYVVDTLNKRIRFIERKN
ncbi:MAG: repeat containing protein [Cyanobacteria bacterium RYN_339]|nr:repeat containing protein [Cyanobacteria bacterium RYN_339]